MSIETSLLDKYRNARRRLFIYSLLKKDPNISKNHLLSCIKLGTRSRRLEADQQTPKRPKRKYGRRRNPHISGSMDTTFSTITLWHQWNKWKYKFCKWLGRNRKFVRWWNLRKTDHSKRNPRTYIETEDKESKQHGFYSKWNDQTWSIFFASLIRKNL